MSGDFVFAAFPALCDPVIRVEVQGREPGDAARGRVPAYQCGIFLGASELWIGHISVRIGRTPFLETYAGHIGYGVDAEHRGRRVAARACLLVRPILLHHGLNRVWLTTNPENVASRRTCEIIGARLVEIVDLPPGCDMYELGERRKCRYRWDLASS